MYYKICIQIDLFTRTIILHCNLWIKGAVILLCIKCFIILPFESFFSQQKHFWLLVVVYKFKTKRQLPRFGDPKAGAAIFLKA